MGSFSNKNYKFNIRNVHDPSMGCESYNIEWSEGVYGNTRAYYTNNIEQIEEIIALLKGDNIRISKKAKMIYQKLYSDNIDNDDVHVIAYVSNIEEKNDGIYTSISNVKLDLTASLMNKNETLKEIQKIMNTDKYNGFVFDLPEKAKEEVDKRLVVELEYLERNYWF